MHAQNLNSAVDLFVLLATVSTLKCEGFRARQSYCFSAFPVLPEEERAKFTHGQTMASKQIDYTQRLDPLTSEMF